MNKVLKRTLCGLGAGSIVMGLFVYLPLKWVPFVLMAISTLGQLEFYAMAKAKYRPMTVLGLAMGVAWLGAVWGWWGACAHCSLAPMLFMAMLLICVRSLFCRKTYENPAGTVAATLAGFFYVPFLLSFILEIVKLTYTPAGGVEEPGARTGLWTVFALVALAKFSDTGGFAFGMAFGKHKLCPAVSPGKSWEGLLGSVVFAAATAAGLLAAARHFDWGMALGLWDVLTYPAAMAAGGVLALAATVCDLIESRFKREFGVKDSSVVLPAGMGGVLDMLDSVLFLPGIFFYAALMAGVAK